MQRLLVTASPRNSADNRSLDLSRQATYTSSNPAVAVVSADGLVTPQGNGSAEIRISLQENTVLARVVVAEMDVEHPVSFRNQVVPIFTKLGCNSGGCHGKATGQNGFKLSLLGFDPDFDFAAVVKEARGRRVFPAAPERSLLLLKACRPGPARRRPQTRCARHPNMPCCCRWIEQGTPAGSGKDPRVTRIECLSSDLRPGPAVEFSRCW